MESEKAFVVTSTQNHQINILLDDFDSMLLSSLVFTI